MAQKSKRATQAKKQQSGGGKGFWLVAAIIAAAGIGWLIFARGGGIGQSVALPTPAEFQSLTAEVSADPSVGVAIGSESAPIELMEFVDYSCPHCATFAGFAGKLLRQNYVETGSLEGGGGPVRWVMFDYVLGSFPNSVPAALAARCAGEQGRFWPMHDLIFARQTTWYANPQPANILEDIAGDVGLDMGAYRQCMSEAKYLPQIAASRKYGDELGVGSTPTIFIDGEMINLQGQEPYSYIEGIIQEKLAARAGGGDAAGN